DALLYVFSNHCLLRNRPVHSFPTRRSSDLQRKFDKVLAQEEVWIRKGIEARRTRNEGRVRRLEALRIERAARRDRVGRAGLELRSEEHTSELQSRSELVCRLLLEKTKAGCR